MKQIIWLILTAYLFFGCNRPKQVAAIKINSIDINLLVNKMTDIMVTDVTNPPLAARFFAYTCLAGYEVLAQNDTNNPSMYGRLNKYPKLEKSDSITGYAYQLSSILAMIETAKKIQPSGFLLEEFEVQYIDSIKKTGLSVNVIDNSLLYANDFDAYSSK